MKSMKISASQNSNGRSI